MLYSNRLTCIHRQTMSARRLDWSEGKAGGHKGWHSSGIVKYLDLPLAQFRLYRVGWSVAGFTSTETVGLLGTGAQDTHLDFHTAPELWTVSCGRQYVWTGPTAWGSNGPHQPFGRNCPCISAFIVWSAAPSHFDFCWLHYVCGCVDLCCIFVTKIIADF